MYKLIQVFLIMMVSLKGFSQVMINEVMPRPSGGDVDACIQSLYNTSNVACGNEWVELYNASPCDTADISCFLLGGKTSSTNAGVFCFPSGTKIPPLSFLTVGGAASGSMISIPALLGQGQICGPSTRWFLENTSGWIALYNPIGTPVDAVFWTFNANSAASLSTNSAFTGGGPACLPTNACGATAPLAAANSAAMSGVIDYAGQVPSAGQTIKRVQDGSITWSTNNVPTIANCNGICATPVNITFTATVVQPSCGNTGSITINVTSSGSSTYTWSANANTGNVNIATSLTAGTYTCTISQNGCVKDTVISLIASSNPAISSISATNVTCNGLTNGTIIISSVINGAQPYQYSINNCVTTQTSNTFNNISSGTYTVCVSDFNGCTATSVVIISQPTALLINSLSTTNPNCSPGNNGSITVNASGGTLAYQYSNNGSALQSSNVFANLGSGTYTITVSDANGCTVTSVQSISAPNAPIFSVAIATNVSCNGGNNGSISSTATGGQGQITYNLQPTNQTNITGSFSNLNANSYTVTATDIAGCSVQTILIVSEPTQLQWTITSATNINCNGGNDGTITATASGGSGQLTYTLQPTNQSNTSGNYSSLGANTYTITASDINGCTITTTLSITAPTAVQWATASSTNVTCNNASNGSITTTASGGTGQITYTLQPTNQSNTSGGFMGLAPNTYTITATDINGCTSTTIITITEPNPLTITSIVALQPTCIPGNDGSLNITASGGTLAYQYSNNGSALQSSNVFANLGSGTYTITVSDANGCTVTSVQSISAPNAPIFSVAIATNVSCNGGNNGSISSTATGGQGQITYNLQPTNQTNITGSFSNLNANSYTVTATDIAGCSVQTILIVSEPTQLQWTITSATNINCNGGNDGTITATASGGSGQLTYTLQPTNQSNTSGNYSSLGANTYTITASDINGCTITTTLSITAPTAVQWATASSTNVTCNNASNGSITTTASGGTGQITYTLQPTNQSNTSGGFMGLAPNTYTITATDINGCTSTTIITITEPNPLSITSIVAVQPTCIPGNDGSLNITASGGTQTYLFSINGGGLQAGSNFGSLISGVYTIQVVDGNGCTATSTVSLIEPNSPVINLVEIISQNCKKNNDIKVTLINGLAPFNFQLLPSGITSSTGLFSNLPIGSYTIIVTDANSCSISTLVSILPSNPVIANLKFNANGSCANANIGEIVVQATGGEPPYSYSIMPGGQISTTGTFSNMGRGVYTITTTDVNECQTTNVITIKGTPCCDELFIPNAFTPNDDTKNDEFTFLNALDTDIELLSFIVMNRYGNSVFQAQHFYDRWDGKYKGSVCDVGTYYYFLKFKCLTSGEVIIRKGDITLIR